VSHARQFEVPAHQTYAVLDIEMAVLHAHANAEARKRENTALADGRFAGRWELR
jgi:hypothetical protein